MTLPKGDQLGRLLGSASRPCWSTENADGALNGQVKPKGPGSQGVWDREQGAVLATQKGHLLSLPSALCFSHQDLHPYSEMSVLTKPHFLGSQVVRTVSPVRLDGELWVSGIMLTPWGSQLLSEGRNPGQGALRASEAGHRCTLLPCWCGSISEQEGKVEEQPHCRIKEEPGLPNSS